jgi:hypothetical protein
MTGDLTFRADTPIYQTAAKFMKKQAGFQVFGVWYLRVRIFRMLVK